MHRWSSNRSVARYKAKYHIINTPERAIDIMPGRKETDRPHITNPMQIVQEQESRPLQVLAECLVPGSCIL